MNLSPNTLTAIATVLLGVIYLAHRDDPRAWNWLKSQCFRAVNALRAKRTTGMST